MQSSCVTLKTWPSELTPSRVLQPPTEWFSSNSANSVNLFKLQKKSPYLQVERIRRDKLEKKLFSAKIKTKSKVFAFNFIFIFLKLQYLLRFFGQLLSLFRNSWSVEKFPAISLFFPVEIKFPANFRFSRSL